MAASAPAASSSSPSPAARRGAQRPRARAAWAEPAWSEGDDACDLGTDIGLEPLPWQRGVLMDWCACDAEGRPAYVTCGLDVPRQNGKNACIEVYEVYRLAVCGWHVLHTAHRVKTAKKSFNRLARYFTDKKHPELMGLVEKIRRTNGEEAIYLTNGGSIEFSARTNGSARGFDDIQLVVFDEAQELTDSQYDAIMYTLAASASGERQIIYTGTPPNEDCPGTVFARTRTAVLSDALAGTTWSSWAASVLPRADSVFDDLLDEVYESNPSMGYLLSEAFTRTEFAGSTITGFAHERLGWFSPAVRSERAIPSSVWEASRTDSADSGHAGKVAMGVKFSPDGSIYALAGCKVIKGGKGRKPYSVVELIEVGPTAAGTRELAEFLAQRWGSVAAVAIDGKDGGEALRSALRELRAPRGFVLDPGTSGVISASANILDGLRTGSVRHTSDPMLETSARKSTRRPIGSRGGWGFGRPERETCDPEPIEACALALWAARTTRRNPKRKQRLV